MNGTSKTIALNPGMAPTALQRIPPIITSFTLGWDLFRKYVHYFNHNKRRLHLSQHNGIDLPTAATISASDCHHLYQQHAVEDGVE